MRNELFSIGPVTIYGYGLMIALGILAAYLTGEYRAEKHGYEKEQIFYFVLYCVLGGFLGSKLLYVITDLDRILKDPSVIFPLSDGWVVYGGIIGGIVSAILYARIRRLKFLAYFDLLMPSVALAQGFGRVGCFLAGCCYGRETDCSIGVVFPDSAYAPAGVALVPTQLFSAGLNVLHFLILLWFSGRKKGDGQVGALYLICYSIGRFVLEYFRGDLARGSVGAFSTSQFISFFILAAGIGLWAYCGAKGEISADGRRESGQPDTKE